jgi:hypothetical protein
MALRSKARAAQLLSLSGSSSSPSASAMPGKGQPLGTEYLISFSIGTPLQPVQVTLDTGSDLVWTQCQPCPSCYAQALPYYEPNLSATSAEIACDAPACQQLDLSSCGTHKWGNRTCVYTYFYGDKSVTNGRLDADTHVRRRRRRRDHRARPRLRVRPLQQRALQLQRDRRRHRRLRPRRPVPAVAA